VKRKEDQTLPPKENLLKESSPWKKFLLLKGRFIGLDEIVTDF